eukprot:GSChrysophyteH1.ASY1.ANO1.2960.1 assembled CDS
MQDQISKLAEVVQRSNFLTRLKYGACIHRPARFTLPKDEYRTALTAGMATFALHVESRIASLKGEGFYTIGPCGEELIGGVGLGLRTEDMTALHYRHLATQLVRQLRNGEKLDDILMDRARAHVVSMHDPITGGNHCSLGSGENDFLVTSTLASQCPPAVGRALGLGLSEHLGHKSTISPDAISYVSLGDGSINNAHFLAAKNLAEYSAHRKFPCPVLFGITDNQKCISLPGHRYLETFEKSFNMAVYSVDGWDLSDIVTTTRRAAEYCRSEKKPAAIIYKNLPRRFGHAATDRQFAYMTEKQIQAEMSRNPLEAAIAQAVDCEAASYSELHDEFEHIQHLTEKSFAEAASEEKATSNPVSVPLIPYSRSFCLNTDEQTAESLQKTEKTDVMRKHMTRFYDEILSEYKNTVYIVADFPPDETTLIGAGIGYSQLGMTPIVEIPYAKYLDCGADMFYEAAIATWLSNGKKPNGMIIRLQGFDRGVFGGNFHTHNTLYMPPGIDVVCYSNGSDYVKGMRYALQQAQAGRIVMTVDSTSLLNLRGKNTVKYPMTGHWTFDDVHKNKNCVVTYGTGVVEAKKAREELGLDVTIIDCPLLSALPANLDLSPYKNVLFLDPCKEGQNPLSGVWKKAQSEEEYEKEQA